MLVMDGKIYVDLGGPDGNAFKNRLVIVYDRYQNCQKIYQYVIIFLLMRKNRKTYDIYI